MGLRSAPLVCAVLCLAAATGGAGEPAAAPPQEVVDATVSRGVEWLRGKQKGNGSFGNQPGETALALMALRHSGVPADDASARRAASNLERSLPDGSVYGAALAAVALLAQDPELHRAKVTELVDDLVASQCRNGQWTYAYRPTARKKAGDNSNTQFAVLALAAARARGIEVDVKAFAACREFLEATQNEDGGWGYSDKERSRSYASMTAGGAMCLALCHAAERGVAAGHPALREIPSVERALEWLGRKFDPARNTGIADAFGGKKGRRSDATWRHYWLWSAERACAAADAERLGEHDWYAAGARHLLDRQQEDGSWRDPEEDLQATCFALLFFARSTRTVLTPKDPPAPVITPK